MTSSGICLHRTIIRTFKTNVISGMKSVFFTTHGNNSSPLTVYVGQIKNFRTPVRHNMECHLSSEIALSEIKLKATSLSLVSDSFAH